MVVPFPIQPRPAPSRPPVEQWQAVKNLKPGERVPAR